MGPRDTPAAQKRAAQDTPGSTTEATTRFGGRSSSANRALSTPALVEYLERAALARDVELVPRPTLEGPTPVAPDLALDAEPPKQRERPPGDRPSWTRRGGRTPLPGRGDGSRPAVWKSAGLSELVTNPAAGRSQPARCRRPPKAPRPAIRSQAVSAPGLFRPRLLRTSGFWTTRPARRSAPRSSAASTRCAPSSSRSRS